jgi:hypothetical protein
LNINKTSQNSASALITALCKADTYRHKTTNIQLIETHISWVLLTGPYAYKIKKPVNFGFLDFSDLEKRHFYCQEELRLNRRLAADWYLEVVPISGQANNPVVDGTGEAIEYAVKMCQFPSARTLKDFSENGQLSTNEIDQITPIVANFHNSIEKAAESSPYGDSHDIKHWFDENFLHIQPLLTDSHQLQELETIQAWSESEWTNKSLLMQQRKQQGFVRECHGDLHLANMTIVNSTVILFDCIEFNPLLRWIDVISEVAFLVMDLIHLGYTNFAFRFLNQYLQHTGDYHGLALMHYYLVYRALVRAKVAILRIAQNPGSAEYTRACNEYAMFANLAGQFIKASRHQPVLIITHGFSGSGKSTFSSQLSQQINAIQIRSDIERKRLFGYEPQTNTSSPTASGIYTQKAGQQTYLHLAELAKVVLESGFSTIIDAAFLTAEQRSQFKQLANECNIKFFIIDFLASDETLCKRITERKNDPSEATIDILRQQQKSAEPFSTCELTHVITVDTESNNALETLVASIKSAAELELTF